MSNPLTTPVPTVAEADWCRCSSCDSRRNCIKRVWQEQTEEVCKLMSRLENELATDPHRQDAHKEAALYLREAKANMRLAQAALCKVWPITPVWPITRLGPAMELTVRTSGGAQTVEGLEVRVNPPTRFGVRYLDPDGDVGHQVWERVFESAEERDADLQRQSGRYLVLAIWQE